MSMYMCLQHFNFLCTYNSTYMYNTYIIIHVGRWFLRGSYRAKLRPGAYLLMLKLVVELTIIQTGMIRTVSSQLCMCMYMYVGI